MHSKNLRAHLDSAAGIASLLPQAERLIRLRQLYEKLVPQQLLKSSAIVNYRQHRVVIFAENNAIAAKLKLLTPRLINDFSQFAPEVTEIRVEVQPRQSTQVQIAQKRPRLSPGGSQSLQALARRLPDSRLKLAVSALAGRGTPDESVQPEKDDQRGARPPKAK